MSIALKSELAPVRTWNKRSVWVRTMIQWHWISSAICLLGMVLFAVTGVTLNHASEIESKPVIINQKAALPAELLATISNLPSSGGGMSESTAGSISHELSSWIDDKLHVSIDNRVAEWSESEVYVSMAGPGKDAWLTIDRTTGDVEFESSWRGWVAYLNDLHKGRHTGLAWSWFLDIFAIGTLVFCLTGFMLLFAHARRRRMTWPLVSLGFIAPLLIALLLIH